MDENENENENENEMLINQVTNDNINNNVSTILDSNSITDLNQIDKDGNTPLGLAAQKGNLKIVELLISKGANVNQTDKHGNTPLYYAVHFNHFVLAKTLINKYYAIIDEPTETLILKNVANHTNIKYRNDETSNNLFQLSSALEIIRKKTQDEENDKYIYKRNIYKRNIFLAILTLLTTIGTGVAIAAFAGGKRFSKNKAIKRMKRIRTRRMRTRRIKATKGKGKTRNLRK